MTDTPSPGDNARPLGWGITVAVAVVVIVLVVETGVVLYSTRVAPATGFGTIVLLGVLIVSALLIVLPVAWLANVLAGRASVSAAEAERQAALRRVATLVARGAEPADVDAAIVTELARGGAPDTEGPIGDFADLVATAIANAETRAELTASRARIMAAADQTRRRLADELNGGVQQRIVALGHGLRAVEASVPPEDQAVRKQLDNVINGLAELYTDLQELSRGLHPGILSKSGLGPALRALARRSEMPVSVAGDVDRRLPESVELAAYCVVAEALANAAQHSRASSVTVGVGLVEGELQIEVADDGVGVGAGVPSAHGGIEELRDRVEALSGRLRVFSPADGGTTLTASIPTGEPRSAESAQP